MKKITRILLIEDDPDDQLFFKLAVADVSRDIICTVASNGLDALRKMDEPSELPELVFLDLNMPIMHGFECLRALKNDMRLSKIPVIILSTSNNINDILKSRENGAAGYLNKPNDLSLLKEKLVELLENDFKTAPFYL